MAFTDKERFRYDPREYGAKCGRCPLGPDGALRDPKHGYIPVPCEQHGRRGNSSDIYAAFAENPATEERQHRRPLVGNSGGMANEGLEAVSINRSNTHLGNVIECMPAGQATGAYGRMEKQLAALLVVLDDINAFGLSLALPVLARPCDWRLVIHRSGRPDTSVHAKKSNG